MLISALLLAGILGSVGVVVVDETGQELPGVTVEVLQQGQVVTRAFTGQAGAIEFTAIKPGTYFIRASLDGFRVQEVQALVSPLAPAEFRLVLPIESMLDYWLSLGVIPSFTGTSCPSQPLQCLPKKVAADPAP